MRDVGKELSAHAVDLLFLFNVLLQLIVGGFQFGNRAFQSVCHLVHVIAEDGDLIKAFSPVPGVKIQMGHPFRNVSELQDGIRDLLGDQPDHHAADERCRDSHVSEEAAGNICAVPHAFQRRAYEKQIAVLQKAPHIQIVHICKQACHDLHQIKGTLVSHEHPVRPQCSGILRRLLLVPGIIAAAKLIIGIIYDMTPQICPEQRGIPPADADGLRVLIQDQDGDVVGGAELLQMYIEIIRADAAALCRFIELIIGLHDNLLLVQKIEPFQKGIVDKPAQQHRPCHQADKNAGKLFSDGISHACSAPFSSGSNL